MFSLDSKIQWCIRSVWKRNQDTLTAGRVIEITTDICKSDCQRSIMQTLSTASAAATAIQWLSAESEGPIHQVECEIDTGAGCNVMPLYMYKSLFGAKELMPTPVQIFGYGESPMANLGAWTITIHTDNRQPQMATCQMTDTRGYLILGRTTAQQVGYIDFQVVTPPA